VTTKDNKHHCEVVSLPDHFSPHREKWSGEQVQSAFLLLSATRVYFVIKLAQATGN